MDSFYLVTKLENMKISQETSIPQTSPTGHLRNYQVRKENSAPKHSKILEDDINRKKKVSCLRKERFGTTEKLWFESLKLCLSF